VRVIRSLETCPVRLQRTGERVLPTSHWIWVTTLSPAQAWTGRAVRIAHQRWDIENQGFNELVNGGMPGGSCWPAVDLPERNPEPGSVRCPLLWPARAGLSG
jgi:hypothetical protein